MLFDDATLRVVCLEDDVEGAATLPVSSSLVEALRVDLLNAERSCRSRSGVAGTREAISKGSFRPTSVG
eukprot:SAG11_NODE_27679_length_330_cov_0.870130_1_plen_69_part_00